METAETEADAQVSQFTQPSNIVSTPPTPANTSSDPATLLYVFHHMISSNEECRQQYTVMKGEGDSHKWIDLATDSEAEEAQKNCFFDSLNWGSGTNIADDTSPCSPGEIGDYNLTPYMSQAPRSPESHLREIEADGCSVDLEDGHESSGETDVIKAEAFLRVQAASPHEVREELNEIARACYGPVELQIGSRKFHDLSSVFRSNNDNNGGKTIHPNTENQLSNPLCLKTKSSGKFSSLQCSPVKGDVRVQEGEGTLRITRHFDLNSREAGWERARGSGRVSSCSVVQENREGDDGSDGSSPARRKRIRKEIEEEVANSAFQGKVGDDKDSTKQGDISPSFETEERSSSSDCDEKQLVKQRKKRVTNMSGRAGSSQPCSEVSSERKDHMDHRVKNESSHEEMQSLQSLRKSSRDLSPTKKLNVSGSGSYLTPMKLSPSQMHNSGEQEDGKILRVTETVQKCIINWGSSQSSALPTRRFKDELNEGKEQASPVDVERGSRRSLPGSGYCEPSRAMDNHYLQRMHKISGGAQTDPDERVAQSSLQMALMQPPSPTTDLELKRKVEELERLVADERKKFQVVAERLAEQQFEADKDAQQKQDNWDVKIRELQKEKYALSIRLQSTETAHLASLLAGRGSSKQAPQTGQSSAGQAIQRRLPSTRQHEMPRNVDLETEQAKFKVGRVKVAQLTAAQLTDQEAQKLRQEIRQQEALIRGYQHENEKAFDKLKQVQADAKEKARIMAEENAKLASQLAHLQRQSANHGIGSLVAQEFLQDALGREGKLKDELAETQEELEKRDAMIAQKDTVLAKSLADLQLELATLKENLAEERKKHARTAASREGKVHSLVENQELLSSHKSTIEEQAAQILELSGKLACYEGERCSRKSEDDWRTPFQEKQDASCDDRAKRVVPPQKQLKKPEPSLQGAKKDSGGLPALAQVSKGGSDDSDKVRKLQLELAALQRQITYKEDENTKNLNLIKQELEKTKQEYEKRVRNLKQQLQTQTEVGPPCFANEQATQQRIKELETQVVNLRIHYVRKMKELTDKLEESRSESAKLKSVAENAANTRKPSANRPVRVKELKDTKERLNLLEDVIDHKELIIKNLHHRIRDLEAGGRGGCFETDAASNSTNAMITAQQLASLTKIKTKIQNSPHKLQPPQVSDRSHEYEGVLLLSPKLTSPRRSLKHASSLFTDMQEPRIVPAEENSKKLKRLNSLTTSVKARKSDSPDDSEPDIVNLRKQLEKSEMSREMLQQQCTEAMEKAALFTLQHQQAIQHLHHASRATADSQLSSTNIDWRSRTHPLERENRALEARLKGMSKELEEAQAMARKPAKVKYAAPGSHHYIYERMPSGYKEEGIGT